MAAVRPTPFFEQRNPLRTPRESELSSSDLGSDDSSDSDAASSSRDEEDSSDSDPDDSVSSGSDADSSDDFRLAETAYPSRTLDRLLEALGSMARADNVGFIAWLIPFTGLSTMLGTELLACATHFDCSVNYPTLSWAATFRPEGYAFTGGMCLTAIFIFVTCTLFFWYLRLRMAKLLREDKKSSENKVPQILTGYSCLVLGAASAISLFGLAVMDMRSHHDAHINLTIAFFITAWLMMISVHTARETVLHEDEVTDSDGRVTRAAGLFTVLSRRSFWLSLRRWRRLDFFTAYTLGKVLLRTGLASTFLCTCARCFGGGEDWMLTGTLQSRSSSCAPTACGPTRWASLLSRRPSSRPLPSCVSCCSWARSRASWPDSPAWWSTATTRN